MRVFATTSVGVVVAAVASFAVSAALGQGQPEIEIEGGPERVERGPDWDRPPLTWDNLEARLEREAREGFSGSVLVVRDGEVVLDKGYGFANREKQIPNRPDTIYCVGSTPIDFTKAGILQLWEQGKVRLDDPITKFFDDVPSEKQGITIEHLMTGQSGLRDFHDLPGDRDPDHTYITRDEAVRRILGFDLLFAPGKGRQHSHSAWGVVAAIIEIVSGQTYEVYLDRHLLGPAGMEDTFNYGRPIPEGRLALGYSEVTDGVINAPPYWGPTSWLVKGSGGMVSTTQDMHRWHQALYSGRLLGEEAIAIYDVGPGGFNQGGSQYGFEIFYTEGRNSRFYMTSNTHEFWPELRFLAEDLSALIWDEELPDFTLGILFAPAPYGPIEIQDVAPGGAAARDGIRPGDRLVSANGTDFGANPMLLLNESLASGDPITFRVERDGRQVSIKVTPNPRN